MERNAVKNQEKAREQLYIALKVNSRVETVSTVSTHEFCFINSVQGFPIKVTFFLLDQIFLAPSVFNILIN